MTDFKAKTISSLIWSAMESFGVQFIGFFITIILARKLLPEQFGLIAMLTIFMAVAQAFIDSGFGAALIQKQDTTQVHYSSAFYFNILLGVMIAGLLWLAAPWIAAFYNQSVLILLTRYLSLNLIISSFGLIQTNLLIKNMDFKTQAQISMIATTLSGGIGIFLAFEGYGVWSLVLQSISGTIFRTVLLWLNSDWHPSREISFVALRELFTFGSRLLASSLLEVIFANLYQLVVGKLFSVKELGYYTRANSLELLPAQNLSQIVGRVAFPAFSMIQDNSTLLKNGLKKSLTFMVMVNFPIMVGLAVCAEPIVLFLFTEKWAPSIPYLQILCISGLLYPLQTINLDLLKAKGRSDLFFRLELIKKALIIINIAITYRWGVLAIIYGQVVLSIIAYFLNSYYTSILVDYSCKEQIKDIIPFMGITGVMGVIVYSISLLPFQVSLGLLLVQVVVGIFVYVFLAIFFRLPVFFEAWNIIQGSLPLFIRRSK